MQLELHKLELELNCTLGQTPTRSGLATIKVGLQQVTALNWSDKSKGSPYSVAERWVPEVIPVLGSQPAGDVSHKPGGRLPLLSAEPAVTLATLRGLLPISLLGEQRHDGCEQFA